MKPTYEELERQLEESKREFRAVDATINNLELKLTDMAVQLTNAESKCRELAAENAGLKDFVKTCFRAAADGASLDGADIQELGERLGLFGRETYQPALHGYICGHEAGEDTVYVMKKTPETDTFLAEVRAQESKRVYESILDNPAVTDMESLVDWLEQNANDSVAFAAQLRQEAAQ